MCTSVVVNQKKTIVGWNLDLLDMEHKVVAEKNMVYIAILDKKEGWLPIFGGNSNGDFVAMPTCWPYDERSEPKCEESVNIIKLDIDLLLGKKCLSDIKRIVETKEISSVPSVTFQAQLSDKAGNVLQIVPGQGYKYLEKPKFSIMTNFSPFKGASEKHPWMGLDRYNIVKTILENSNENFNEKNMFEILKSASQTVCPTVVSMVFDVTESKMFWCENMHWEKIQSQQF